MGQKTNMKNNIKDFIVKYWVEIFIFVILTFVIFWHLGKYALADWDEAIYADISRNVLHGNFLTLKWGSWDWFQKPPLYMWIEASFFKLFGVSEFSARLTSALSGLGLSYLIYLIAKEFFNKKVAIFALATVLLNTFLLAWFRFATIDIIALFLNTLAIYFFWLSQNNKKYLIWCFIVLGLAGMAKGPVVIAIGLTFLIYLLLTRQTLTYLKNKYFYIGLAIFLLILLPWHLYMINKFGSNFIDEYFVYQILTRAKEPIEGHFASWLYYPKLILKTFPLCLILFFSVFVPKEKISIKRKEFLFLSIWLVLQYFSIAKVATVLDWYILPVFIPLQILSAAIMVILYEKWKTPGKIFLFLIVLFGVVLCR